MNNQPHHSLAALHGAVDVAPAQGRDGRRPALREDSRALVTAFAERGDRLCRSSRPDLAALLRHARFTELEPELEPEHGVLWCRFSYRERPCFTPALLDDIEHIQRLVRQAFDGSDPAAPPLRYMVWASRDRMAWNLGGDLDLFVRLIQAGDRATLRHYAHQVVREGYANWAALDLPLITVALVQGDALGGGFEAALSSNIIVAERSAKFGLPEILFNLFPGMGAYSFLARRMPPSRAERMIMEGGCHRAEQLHAWGAVDVLAEDGCGESVLRDHIARHGRRHAAHRAILKTRRWLHPVTLEELQDITDLWVDTALTLDPADLRKMARLVAAQDRRHLPPAQAA